MRPSLAQPTSHCDNCIVPPPVAAFVSKQVRGLIRSAHRTACIRSVGTWSLWCAMALTVGDPICWAAELIRLTPNNYSQLVPEGKEVDAIIGDYVLRNERVTAVIAQAAVDRKANMTVRGVAGMLIDFTQRHQGSDQLSCFYPTAGRYLFEQPAAVTCAVDGRLVQLEQWSTAPENGESPREPERQEFRGRSISLSFAGKAIADDGTTATVTYTLVDDSDWLSYQVELHNGSDTAVQLPVEESLRCDGNLFTTSHDAELKLFAATDVYFGQSYGFMLNDDTIQVAGSGRNLRLKSSVPDPPPIAPGQKTSWGGKIYCSQGLPGVRSWAAAQSQNQLTVPMQLLLQSTTGPVAQAVVEVFHDDRSLGVMQTNAQGIARSELLPGRYRAVVTSLGRDPREVEFAIVAGRKYAESITLPAASRVRGEIVDGLGEPIAAKVQFSGIDGTPDPNFGPDSASDAVKNLVYCAAGKFEQPIPTGHYRVIISHGTEYDVVTTQLEVGPGQLVPLTAQLIRSVDTSGWISADFHSHSSPSGDNVSEQRGRVLNLLAEHIEFAPCTEHNRIDSYEDDLLALRATGAMATCTGIELTGSPLPINHQNAFPLHRHEHEQDGGGPTTDADPVKQIERLALWDNSSSKVVQSNHPNIPQILGDVDLDGQPDGGFRGMLGWMDVIEVHPPEGIFAPPAESVSPQDKYKNPIFCWMQLLNLGYRITGVVNTDAHYNFHGSGWLRNYLESSTDDPASIKVDEMIHSAEHGHLTMTTGPFLEVKLRVGDGDALREYGPGEDVRLTADAKTVRLWVRVQCPNWFDINRVQVFANGRPLEQLNFTRQQHPEQFSNQPVRFEKEIELPKLERDTHIIVATIGEGLTLGAVMGPESGKLPPVAVANPIFVDVDGSGFQPNGDNLGVPFMLEVPNSR